MAPQPSIALDNRQRVLRVRRAALRDLALALAGRLPHPLRELGVILSDDAGIVRAKAACFGRAEVTDVVAQNYVPLPGEPPGLRGEIVVNAARAALLGRTRPGAARELALYIAHGLDHLAGADDAAPAARRRMRARELRWLRRPEIRRLVQKTLK